MSTLKKITGKLLALGVSLHSRAIHRHVQSFKFKALAATNVTKQAESDVLLAKRAFGAAVQRELDAHAEHEAVYAAAQIELAALPSVAGYGRVRPNPPFGAKPQVIDKRNA